MTVESTPCELISWEQCYGMCRDLAATIRAQRLQFDLLVAIGRGGYMPGRILSDLLGSMNLTSFKIEHYLGAQKSSQAIVRYGLNADVDGRRILLIDDVSDSGDTFKVAMQHIQSLGAPRAVTTAVLHHKVVSRYEPDLYAEKITQWRWLIYPWAVIEDLSTFINGLDIRQAPRDVIAERILLAHGIRVSDEQIKDALAIMQE
jgi:hypoxanthine phosphoribosyltransferase